MSYERPRGNIRVHVKAHERKAFDEMRDGEMIHEPAAHVPAYDYTERDRGNPGHGPEVIPKLKEGKLSRHGYHLAEGDETRHAALERAVSADGYAPTVERVNALRVLFKNTKPHLSANAHSDVEFLERKYR